MDDVNQFSFSPVEKETLSEKIIQQILAQIENGQLKPGDKLPGEKALAKMFKVGGPTIREVIRALALLGILENQQGRGTYVAQSGDLGSAAKPLSIMLSIKKSTLLAIHEAREALELKAIALAAERHTQNDINDLKMLVKKLSTEGMTRPEYLELDSQFHGVIARAAKSSIIEDVLGKLHRMYFETRKVLYGNADYHELINKINVTDHAELLALIESGQAEKAAQAMKRHLDTTQVVLDF